MALRNLIYKQALPRGTRPLSRTTLAWSVVDLQDEATFGVSGSSKNINKQTWLQCHTQQDLRWNYPTQAHVWRQMEVGFNAEVPTLTWLVLYYEYQNEVRSVHESIYPSLPNNYTTMEPSSTSHEKARHSTHAYLVNFRVYVEVF